MSVEISRVAELDQQVSLLEELNDRLIDQVEGLQEENKDLAGQNQMLTTALGALRKVIESKDPQTESEAQLGLLALLATEDLGSECMDQQWAAFELEPNNELSPAHSRYELLAMLLLDQPGFKLDVPNIVAVIKKGFGLSGTEYANMINYLTDGDEPFITIHRQPVGQKTFLRSITLNSQAVTGPRHKRPYITSRVLKKFAQQQLEQAK